MTTNFKEFALSPALHDSLNAMNFSDATPIQALAIPLALEGRDLLGSAQTGTGKTGAFSIPMINALMLDPKAHALVMAPTRELATQVLKVAKDLIGNEKGIKTALLIGGEPIGKQYEQLRRRPRLIVGTPGRINDHLRSNPELLDFVKFVVLDEADRMLDMGFSVQIDTILERIPEGRQTLMFSATFPESIVKFSKKYLNEPERISAGEQSKPGENITQTQVEVSQEKKHDMLEQELSQRTGSVIIFVRTKHGADKLADKLSRSDHKVEALHGGLRQRQRDRVVQVFRQNKIRIVVATDVAARGLDIPHVEHVINYDLPQVAEDYIHRIGRTARAGAKGEAISFVSPGERGLWRDIERLLDPATRNSTEPREGGRKGGNGFGKKSYGDKKSFGKPFGGFGGGQRKPFGRADRQDRKKSEWDPSNDFQRSEGRSEGGYKKPYNKPNDYASNPDSYKEMNRSGFANRSGGNSEGRSFKKPYQPRSEGGERSYSNDRPSRSYGDRPARQDGERSYNKPRSFGDRPARQDGERSYNNDRPARSYGDRPARQDGERSFSKPRSFGDRPARQDGERSYNNDRPARLYGDRPARQDGERSYNKPRSEGGFDKPRRDGDRPFRKEGEGFKKPFSRDDRDGNKAGKKPFGKPSFASKGKSDSRGGDKPMTRGAKPAQKSNGMTKMARGRSY
jgi:ATP-dependent RNA helicase DeaD